MPNWYVAADGLSAENVKTTSGEDLKFVAKFDTKGKWKRSADDMYNPFTPQERLKRIEVEEKKPSNGSIIPTPVEMVLSENNKYVNINGWVIVPSAGFEDEAIYLRGKLKLSIANNSGINTNIIRLLQKNVDVKVDEQSSTSGERYEVEVSESMITISAPESSGIFNGIQSLLALTNVEKKQVLMVWYGIYIYKTFCVKAFCPKQN